MGNKYYCKLVLQNIKTWKISTRLFDTEEDLDKFVSSEHTKRNYIIVQCILGDKYTKII